MAGETQAEMRRSQFLLGLSSEADRERLEAEFFADDDAFQEMLTAEDDLIDAYVRGELAGRERKEFEKRFMTSSQGRERVQFARALAGNRAAEPEVVMLPGFFASITSQGALLRVGAAMAVLVVAGGFAWLLIDRSRMNNELRELRAERARLTEQTAELQRVVDAERARNAGSNNLPSPKPTEEVVRNEEPRPQDRSNTEGLISMTFDLSPGSTRSGGGTNLPVPQKTRFIVLQLNLERPSVHNEYSASLETADGNPVWRKASFGSRPNATELERVGLPPIPARDLPPGDYVLFLSGKISGGDFEPVASYSFRITRK